MPVETSIEPFVVAYQGAPGAFSESAAIELAGSSAERLSERSLEDVFTAVSERRARFGVVPLENTIAGTVPDAYELMLSHELVVIAETRALIEHALIGPEGLALEDVRRVLSHPVALGQCGKFLRANPAIQPRAVFDTAGAVEMVMQQQDGATAAIASERSAALYGARVIATKIQDHPENWTRFALVARAEDAPELTDATRTLIAFDLPHEPGSLVRALQPLADRGVNLTKIESRPIPTRPFEYRFIAELAIDDGTRMADGVEALRARTAWLRVLGRYRADVHALGRMS